MKIFDFTNGSKGAIVDELPRTSYATGAPVVVDPVTGKKFYLKIGSVPLGNNDTVTLMKGAGTTFRGKPTAYLPENFGCEAILYCTGEMFTGVGFKESLGWHWEVIGTDEWLAKNLGAFTQVPV